MIEHIKCSTPDFAMENAKKLFALLPECEGQKGEVVLDKLRQDGGFPCGGRGATALPSGSAGRLAPPRGRRRSRSSATLPRER